MNLASMTLLLALVSPAQSQEDRPENIANSFWRVKVEGESRTRTLKINRLIPKSSDSFTLEAEYAYSDERRSSVAAELQVTTQGNTLHLTTQSESKIVAKQSSNDKFTAIFTPKSGTSKPALLQRISADEAQALVVTRTEVAIPAKGITLAGFLFRQSGMQRPRPGVVILHGWGERQMNGAATMALSAIELAQAGYTALTLSMRGWPKTGGDDDCGLEQPDDIAKALDWFAQSQDVDSNRIAVLGHSQGGQVALVTAARSKVVRAVVAYYPVVDIERWRNTTSLDGIRDYYIPRICRPNNLRSPLLFVQDIHAPVLLIHGDLDTRVPTEQSIIMHQALQKLGRTSELQIIPGAVHGFNQAQRATALPLVLDFLARQLPAPQKN